VEENQWWIHEYRLGSGDRNMMRFLILFLVCISSMAAPRLGTNHLHTVSINLQAAPYNAVGDGVTDDSEAMADAIDAAEINGGTIFLPTPALYKFTRPFVISSRYPVNIISDMYGGGRNGYTNKSAILLATNIGTNFLFTYKSPTTNRADNGSGTIRGLYITDLSGGVGTPGTNDCGGIFSLYDFNYGKMELIQIEHIKGSAVRTDFVIKSNFRDMVTQYNGDTGQPNFWVSQTSSTYTTQGCDFENIKFEVNHAAPYFQEDAGPTENKGRNFVFESDTLIAGSQTNFMFLQGTYNTYSQMTFNRNTAVQVRMAGTLERMDKAVFRGTANTTEAIIVSGNYNTIEGTFNSGKTGVEVYVTGNWNILEKTMALNSGRFILYGQGNTIDGGKFAIGAGVPSFTGDWISITNDCTVQGVTIVGVSNLVNGVRMSGTGPKLLFSTLKGLNYGYYNESANAMPLGNHFYNNTFDFTNTIATPLYQNNLSASGEYLQAHATFDPPSIGSGETIQISMPVTNAVPGDFAEASISAFTPGVIWFADIHQNNVATVTAWNVTGSPIDISSSTLYVKVRKSFSASANNNGTVTPASHSTWRSGAITKTSGTAVLVGGTVVVNTPSVTANSRIILTANVTGGTPGALYVSARSAGASFTITSTSGTDTSTVAWMLFEP
jgi:hypothetical protein